MTFKIPSVFETVRRFRAIAYIHIVLHVFFEILTDFGGSQIVVGLNVSTYRARTWVVDGLDGSFFWVFVTTIRCIGDSNARLCILSLALVEAGSASESMR